ncbi:hypothetical protein BH18CHL1_BH18CHL1_00110 [soil metagenome]
MRRTHPGALRASFQAPVEPSPRRRGARQADARRGRTTTALTMLTLAALLASALMVTGSAMPLRAGDDGDARPRAVVVVGPSAERMAENMEHGEIVARQAEAAGFDVSRVYHPRATWGRVRERAEGANLLVYLGHGNGWPSPYPPFQERTKNGFGLNAHEGDSAFSTEYQGGDPIRDRLRLADNAVVMLYFACYASGRGELGQPRPSREVARQRADNFAAAFLDERVGAGAVFAFWTVQAWSLPRELMRRGQTMDQVFRTPGSFPGSASGFVGSDDSYLDSSRIRGARIHLDPHPEWDYSRSVTGDLGLTTDEWFGGSAPPDAAAPELSELSVVGDAGSISDGDPPAFSPNGDGIADEMTLRHRVSTPAWIDIRVTDAGGDVRRRLTSWSDGGEGRSTWGGEDDAGRHLPDGLYRISATARDQDGDRSEPLSLDVAALGTLRAPAWSRARIHSRDGDGVADEAGYTVQLTTDATFGLRIENAEGAPVRTIRGVGSRDQGPVTASWDGRNGTGAAVPDGRYWAVATATTAVGTITTRSLIRVGAYGISLSDRTPRRGQRITLHVLAVEPQGAAAPTVRLEQPGLAPYTVSTARLSGGRSEVSLTLRSGGSAGTLRLTVSGHDAGGQAASWSRSVPLD